MNRCIFEEVDKSIVINHGENIFDDPINADEKFEVFGHIIPRPIALFYASIYLLSNGVEINVTGDSNYAKSLFYGGDKFRILLAKETGKLITRKNGNPFISCLNWLNRMGIIDFFIINKYPKWDKKNIKTFYIINDFKDDIINFIKDFINKSYGDNNSYGNDVLEYLNYDLEDLFNRAIKNAPPFGKIIKVLKKDITDVNEFENFLLNNEFSFLEGFNLYKLYTNFKDNYSHKRCYVNEKNEKNEKNKNYTYITVDASIWKLFHKDRFVSFDFRLCGRDKIKKIRWTKAQEKIIYEYNHGGIPLDIGEKDKDLQVAYKYDYLRKHPYCEEYIKSLDILRKQTNLIDRPNSDFIDKDGCSAHKHHVPFQKDLCENHLPTDDPFLIDLLSTTGHQGGICHSRMSYQELLESYSKNIPIFKNHIRELLFYWQRKIQLVINSEIKHEVGHYLSDLMKEQMPFIDELIKKEESKDKQLWQKM